MSALLVTCIVVFGIIAVALSVLWVLEWLDGA